MDCRNDSKYKNSGLQTEIQWRKKKKIPKSEDAGIELYTNGYRQETAIYFSPEEVRDMTQEELEPIRKKAREQAKKYKEKKLEEERKKEEEIKRKIKRLEDKATFLGKNCRYLALEMCKQANGIIPCDNPGKTIVIDVETTGLSTIYDEVLQISIIDGDGKELFNQYVKPYWTYQWQEAERINGIDMEKVRDMPYMHEIIPQIKGIIESADTIIGYNTCFDLEMLEKYGIKPKRESKIRDVMREYAVLDPYWDEEHGEWVSLYVMARAFDYEYKAHDSLEDAKATLFCYGKLEELRKELGESQEQ